MPILATEPNIFPAMLLEPSFSLDSLCVATCDGWAFYTRARQEKCLARELLRRGIAFYLPLVLRRLLIRGRPVQSSVPLFSGYLFVFGSGDDRASAMKTNRVAQVLQVQDRRQLLVDLQNIQKLINTGVPLTVESRFQPNQPVRIRSGAMQGLEGTVHRRKGQSRLVVWIAMLHQGVSLEIDDFLLEPI